MSKNSSGSRSRNNRHPPGLSGKEIGMYYKNLSMKRKMESGGGDNKRIVLGPSVSIPPTMLDNVEVLLGKVDDKSEEEKVGDEFEKRFRGLLSVDFAKFIEESKRTQEDTDTEHINALSKRFMSDMLLRESSENFRRRYEERQKLPAMKYGEEIVRCIKLNQVTLIVGSTGCGKTTQVTQMLLDDYIYRNRGAECRIICTQPRRISAITVAERVASERCESLGSSVGYIIRLQSTIPREHGSILYCTTGILLQKMQTDPLLRDLTHVILDEIHERSVESDLLMGLLKKILPHRPDLKVILMSATVSERDFSGYFDSCFTVYIEGTLFPVDIVYLEDIIQETGFTRFITTPQQSHNNRGRRKQRNNGGGKIDFQYEALIEPYLRQLRDKYDAAVIQALRCPESEGCASIPFLEFLIFHICEHKPPGAILVFLPGYDKISKLHTALQNSTLPNGKRFANKIQVYPLHSLMPTVNQTNVFKPSPEGVRKIILSTIIAETSVTIEDVVYVINTGRTKISNYDADANIQTLEEAWVTKANTKQRMGRAGRVQPGICYNLFTKARERTMDDIPTPEILRCKLESIILNLKLLHITDESEFLQTLLAAPNPVAIENGIKLLKRINALDKHGILTPLGMHLARLPIDPQMGKMCLMAALFRCIDPITSVAAGLSYRSPFFTPLGKEQRVDNVKHELAGNTRSDHLLLDNVITNFRLSLRDGSERDYCYKNFLSLTSLYQLVDMKNQFTDLLRSASFIGGTRCTDKECNVNSKNVPLLRAIIAAGLYPNMAHLRKARQIRNRVHAIHSMSTPEEKRVNFHPSSVNSGVPSFDSNYFVYFQKQKSSALYLLDATMVFPISLLIFGDEVEAGITPEKEHYISVANSFYFKCDKASANVIIKLRHRMEWLLQKKALYPSTIEPYTSEAYLITAIQMLLSLDEVDDYQDQFLSSDDDFNVD